MQSVDTISDLFRLKPYTRTKQTIAHEIRILTEFLRENVGEREAEDCRRLIAKLTEDRFTLAVVGQFKRGKSSLINAVVGRELLPTGVLPVTSAITVLRYGSEEKLNIFKQDSPSPESIPLSSIAEYVTEKGNPGNRRKVAQARLELPVQFLRGGLELVDTPGVGSAIEANTATTLSFIPQSDAVVFVTSVDSPLTLAEIDFLESTREHVRKIFYVLNKVDLVQDAERQEILQSITERLKRIIGADELNIFPVSSLKALNSMRSGRREENAQAGIRALQENLSDFLAREKNNALLVSILDKALRLAREASHGLNLLKAARGISPVDLNGKLEALNSRFDSLREARSRRLDAAEDSLLKRIRSAASQEAETFLPQRSQLLLQDADGLLARFRWKLSCRLFQRFSADALAQFRKNLDEWAKRETARLNLILVEMRQGEWEKSAEEVYRIPIAVTEILEVPPAELPSQGASPEPPAPAELPQPVFNDLRWTLKAPLLLAYVPVFLVKSILRNHFRREVGNLMGLCRNRMRKVFDDGVAMALKHMRSEAETLSIEMESRIVQAMKGKQLSKARDGHWQLTPLDPEGLSQAKEALSGIEKRIFALRREMLQARPNESVASSTGVSRESSEVEPSGLPSEAMISPAPEKGSLQAADDLFADLGTRGCPVCRRMIRKASDFFAEWQYALSIQDEAQRIYAASRGFCPLHTWQLVAIASPVGLSKGYPELMERLAADLSVLAEKEDPDVSNCVRALVSKRDGCRVCRLQKDTETSYLNRLSEFLTTPEGRKAYTYSQGLCLNHLGMLAVLAPSRETVRFLLEHAARRFVQVSEDMKSYALKFDAPAAASVNIDEMDAYLRGVTHVVGEKELCSPWELDAGV